LTKFFSIRELEQLDDENEEIAEDCDLELDFYEITHLPV